MQDDIVPTPEKETPPTNSPTETTPTSQYVSPGPMGSTTPVAPADNTPAPVSPFEAETTQPLNPEPVTPSPTLPVVSGKSNKKKKLIVSLIIVAVLAVLGGAGAAAYNLWFQNPDKVIGDALVSAVRAKTVSYTGSFDYKTKESSSFHMKLTVDGKNTHVDGETNVKLAMTIEGKDFNVSGSGLYDKDANLYFKVNNIRKTIDDTLGMTGVDLPKEVDDFITKIDGKWIKISVDDIKEFSEKYADTQKCVKDTMKKYEDDKSATKEVIDLYNKSKFIVVKEKLGSKDGSLGYVIKSDTNKTKTFVKGFNDTKIMKELQKCDESFKLEANDINDDSTDESKTRFEVWVDRWSHQITKLRLTSNDESGSAEALIEPKFNQLVNVDVPKDFIKLSELKDDIDAITGVALKGVQERAKTATVSATANHIIKKAEAYNSISGQYPTLSELKNAQDEAALGDELQGVITASEPTATTSTLVQYVLTGPATGGYVAYYDATSKSVVKIEFGNESLDT